MRLIQWEFYTPTESGRIYPLPYGRLSHTQEAGDLAPVSIGYKRDGRKLLQHKDSKIEGNNFFADYLLLSWAVSAIMV